MRKFLFIAGTFSLMLLSMSYLFSVMVWDGAKMMRIFGFALLMLVLVSGALRTKSILMYTGSLALLFVLIANLLNAVGLPGYALLLSSGILIFSIVFLPIMGWWMYKHSRISPPQEASATNGQETEDKTSGAGDQDSN